MAELLMQLYLFAWHISRPPLHEKRR